MSPGPPLSSHISSAPSGQAPLGGSDPVGRVITVHDSDSDADLSGERCDVADMFRLPRICARAALFGLVPGLSHDLDTQVDLSTVRGRA